MSTTGAFTRFRLPVDVNPIAVSLTNLDPSRSAFPAVSIDTDADDANVVSPGPTTSPLHNNVPSNTRSPTPDNEPFRSRSSKTDSWARLRRAQVNNRLAASPATSVTSFGTR